TKTNVGDIERLSVSVVVNYKTPADGKPLPSIAVQLNQIEDLTRDALGFSDKRVDTLNVVNSPVSGVDNPGGELHCWQQQSFIDQLLAAGRRMLELVLFRILWPKAVWPQLPRRVVKAKEAQEQVHGLLQ
ncbi:flagellar M-ring protein FliF C-terminal domain-containing protein, partial [Salmonella enterica]|uniref:flagellar M-ring protein FliF C-terminal domain-containing protein n=1 Tax=Salmonella enterica TaxID=28901 RepID=UPI000A8539C0